MKLIKTENSNLIESIKNYKKESYKVNDEVVAVEPVPFVDALKDFEKTKLMIADRMKEKEKEREDLIQQTATEGKNQELPKTPALKAMKLVESIDSFIESKFKDYLVEKLNNEYSIIARKRDLNTLIENAKDLNLKYDIKYLTEAKDKQFNYSFTYYIPENLNEEKLDEKIPTDLAKVYKQNNPDFQNLPRRGGAVGGNEYKPAGYVGSLKDYENADYVEITPEEATAMRKMRGDISSLRTIVDDYLIQFDREGRQIYYNNDVSREHSYKNKNNIVTRDTRKMPPAYIFSIASKIYKTNEDELEIDDEKKARRLNNLNSYVDDTGEHQSRKKSRDWDEESLNISEESIKRTKDEIERLNKLWDDGEVSRKEYESKLSSLEKNLEYYTNRLKDARTRVDVNRFEKRDAAAKKRNQLSNKVLQKTLDDYNELKRQIKTNLRDIDYYEQNFSQYDNFKAEKTKIEDLKTKLEALQNEIARLEANIQNGDSSWNYNYYKKNLENAQTDYESNNKKLQDILSKIKKPKNEELDAVKKPLLTDNLKTNIKLNAKDLALDVDDIDDSGLMSEIIGDYLANKYGYCNNGFKYDVTLDAEGEPETIIISDIDWDTTESDFKTDEYDDDEDLLESDKDETIPEDDLDDIVIDDKELKIEDEVDDDETNDEDDITPTPIDSVPEQGIDMGVAGVLNTSIVDTWTNIDKLNSAIATLRETETDPTIVDTLQAIANGEMENVGKLEKALEKVSPNAKTIETTKMDLVDPDIEVTLVDNEDDDADIDILAKVADKMYTKDKEKPVEAEEHDITLDDDDEM